MKISRHFAWVAHCICITLYFNQSVAGVHPGSMGIMGDTADVRTTTGGGTVLIGGGGNVKGAFEWMIKRSGGGDVVVLTASGNDGYNKDIFELGGVNSVETLNITSRALADNDTVALTVRNAEMLFIAGGDQSRYMFNWRNTKLSAAINYLMLKKKVPVGGTSAGCAILTGLYYSGENGSAVSDSALLDPYHTNITVYNNDFLHAPYLSQAISDQHYVARKREGRHVAFMARIIKDYRIFPRGIAPDERTAVCIDETGKAMVVGEGKAYFLRTNKKIPPELCAPQKPLQWKGNNDALIVYEVQGTSTGAGNFSVTDFAPAKASGGIWYQWWVEDGVLYRKQKDHQ